MFNPFSLEGKYILITGASSGIGQQCAIDCSKMGASIVLIGRNVERLNETLSCMKNGQMHTILALDLLQYDEVKVKIAELVQKKGRFNGLVNCAGISTTLPLKLGSQQKLTEIFETNVFSAYNLTREVCRMGHFSKEGGSVIFLSSIMGLVGDNCKSLYSMTKGALISGVRSLAVELAPKNIRVNSISSGVIITPINRNLPHIVDSAKRALLEKKHLLGFGKTTDISNACVFLLSESSRWVTGQNLIVDGGYTII